MTTPKQIKAVKFPGSTIQLSDTVDQFSRKVHVNVRNEKVTLVYRWKSKHDSRAHTQRITLDDSQTARLLASVSIAASVAIMSSPESKTRGEAIARNVKAQVDALEKQSGLQ